MNLYQMTYIYEGKGFPEHISKELGFSTASPHHLPDAEEPGHLANCDPLLSVTMRPRIVAHSINPIVEIIESRRFMNHFILVQRVYSSHNNE